MSNSFGGTTVGTNYRGNRAFQPPNWVFEPRNPGIYDTENVSIGDLWLNTTKSIASNPIWVLVSLAGTSQSKGMLANWIQWGSGTGLLTSLTSNNTAVTVFGDVNQNINVIGDGTTISGVGNNATHTITLSVVGGMAANSFITSSPVATPTIVGGTATPLVGVINMQGSHNISVSAGTVNTGAINDIVYWLNNSITLGDLAVLGSGVTALSATTGDIQLLAGNIRLPNTNTAGSQGEIRFGGNRWISNFGTQNTFVGQTSGNTTLTVANAINNIGIGSTSLSALTTGSGNVFVGNSGGTTLTTGSSNAGLGSGSLALITTGSNNIALGVNSGLALVSSESNNVLIDSQGVVGDNNTARIGQSTGTGSNNLNRFFAQGIRGITTDANNGIPVLISSTGQLGTGDGFLASGNWTPVVTFGGGSTGITYTIQAGTYNKIGNLVFVSMTVFFAKGSSTGAIIISGLPYPCTATVNPEYDLAVTLGRGITASAGCTYFHANVIDNTTTIQIYEDNTAGGIASQLNDTFFSSSINFTIQGFYSIV